MNTAGRPLAPASSASLLALLASLALACASDRGATAKDGAPANERMVTTAEARSDEPNEKHSGATAPDLEPPVPPAARAWEGADSVKSNAGTYQVLYRTHPAEIPRGESFAIEAWVFAAGSPDRPLEGLRLSADAAMPEHGHGMNRVPRVEALADGGFRVEGMYFHMPGLWQLYLDVTRGALTERAQLDTDLE